MGGNSSKTPNENGNTIGDTSSCFPDRRIICPNQNTGVWQQCGQTGDWVNRRFENCRPGTTCTPAQIKHDRIYRMSCSQFAPGVQWTPDTAQKFAECVQGSDYLNYKWSIAQLLSYPPCYPVQILMSPNDVAKNNLSWVHPYYQTCLANQQQFFNTSRSFPCLQNYDVTLGFSEAVTTRDQFNFTTPCFVNQTTSPIENTLFSDCQLNQNGILVQPFVFGGNAACCYGQAGCPAGFTAPAHVNNPTVNPNTTTPYDPNPGGVVFPTPQQTAQCVANKNTEGWSCGPTGQCTLTLGGQFSTQQECQQNCSPN